MVEQSLANLNVPCLIPGLVMYIGVMDHDEA